MAKIPYAANTTKEEPAHIDLQLLQLARDIWRPTPLELKKLRYHLSDCEHCRVILRTLREAQKESRKLSDRDASEKYHHHLSLIAKTIRQVHDPNIVGSYVETLEQDGREEASKRFPILAAHLEVCSWCRNDVEEIQKVIQEMVRAGLIAPPTPHP